MVLKEQLQKAHLEQQSGISRKLKPAFWVLITKTQTEKHLQ